MNNEIILITLLDEWYEEEEEKLEQTFLVKNNVEKMKELKKLCNKDTDYFENNFGISKWEYIENYIPKNFELIKHKEILFRI